jgi:hypothetical protein
MHTFKIHALGPSGAGKTVFMASMYRQLQLRRPETVFSLKTDYTGSLELNAIFNRLANPAETWPESSRTIKEWTFTACVASKEGTFEPLAFTYLDYPGVILTNPQAAEDEKVQDVVMKLRSANGLLALLDGQALGALMQGDREGDRFLDFELTSTLEIVQESRCPIHFAITKWDLLEATYTLGQIRDRLMKSDRFAAVIAARSQASPATIRLIPVSSVGAGFAVLQPNGEMRKVGGAPRPYQIDLPLMCVIPDFLQFVYDDMEQRDKQILEGREDRNGNEPADNRWRAVAKVWAQKAASDKRWMATAKRVAMTVAPHVRRAILLRSPSLGKYMPDDPDFLVEELFQLLERAKAPVVARAESDRARYQAELASSRAAVDSERSALDLMQREFSDQLKRFEVMYPESVLTGGLRASHDGGANESPDGVLQ